MSETLIVESPRRGKRKFADGARVRGREEGGHSGRARIRLSVFRRVEKETWPARAKAKGKNSDGAAIHALHRRAKRRTKEAGVSAMTALVGIRDVAKLLSVSVITIRRKVSAGELPCIRLSKGGPMRFDLRDVEKFVEQHKH
jgi:excisionase family DNA binding protein